jgi:phosphatidylglycerophosphate synthase
VTGSIVQGFVQRWVATRAGFKPRDVEEPIDYYWHRPLAGLLVQLLAKTSATPNQVTVASGVVSLMSGGAIAAGAWVHPLCAALGGVLLLASIVLDCADGQLARLKGISTAVGRILDGTMDAVAPTAVFTGMVFYLLSLGHPPLWVWLGGAAAAASLTWHASMYDVSKNIYLSCSRPDFSLGGTTLVTPDAMRELKREFDERGERFYALLMTVWVHWTKPQMKAMSPWLDPERAPQVESERELYRHHFRGMMRAMSWLGFGTHLFLLTMAALLAPWQPNLIWVAWLIMLVPMNVLALWLTVTRARRERMYQALLAAQRSTRGGG